MEKDVSLICSFFVVVADSEDGDGDENGAGAVEGESGEKSPLKKTKGMASFSGGIGYDPTLLTRILPTAAKGDKPVKTSKAAEKKRKAAEAEADDGDDAEEAAPKAPEKKSKKSKKAKKVAEVKEELSDDEA